ncbi:hypothetical protein PGAG_00439 [Phaeocystis globosa virus 12T]|uniref:Tail fiber protein n=1 Tax=Phaeocystis globosa virus PgV-16T TaxID=3071227 RepID=A0AC59EWN7_9VIRU|nr:tail fiber protein [Phaeocystis globosa virus]AET72850.1 hypothetical protein PGAG_00439 [Phaeocystis globosa virus 12T]AGM15351.1 tail fiber protein [Phaeocystis globosa virus PgV-16T]UYE94081.1 tail fiber protein [Phaeocystis globosa virus]
MVFCVNINIIKSVNIIDKMSLNKVITSVNALVNKVSIPDDKLNNVVCIDIENNRIGVKNGSPKYEIDISGTLKTDNIYVTDLSSNGIDVSGIISDVSFIKNVGIEKNLTVLGTIAGNDIDVSGIVSDVSFIENVGIEKNLTVLGTIKGNDIDVSGIVSDVSFIENVDILKKLDVTGSIYHTSGTLITSDDRYKHNEKMITNGLEVIRQLQPQTYDKTRTFKAIDYRGVVNEEHIKEAGLIAQELIAINDLSFAVIEGDNTNPYYVRYDNVFIYGLAGIKELDTKVTNLSERVSNITNGTPDIPDVNVSNILDFVRNQNTIIQTLNEKIRSLETRVNNLE